MENTRKPCVDLRVLYSLTCTSLDGALKHNLSSLGMETRCTPCSDSARVPKAAVKVDFQPPDVCTKRHFPLALCLLPTRMHSSAYYSGVNGGSWRCFVFPRDFPTVRNPLGRAVAPGAGMEVAGRLASECVTVGTSWVASCAPEGISSNANWFCAIGMVVDGVGWWRLGGAAGVAIFRSAVIATAAVVVATASAYIGGNSSYSGTFWVSGG